MKATVTICSRCGKNHIDLEYRKFIEPLEATAALKFTHWALCPITGEPILMRESAPPPAPAEPDAYKPPPVDFKARAAGERDDD